MQQGCFLKAGGATTLAAVGIRPKPVFAHMPPHNIDKYDFGAVEGAPLQSW